MGRIEIKGSKLIFGEYKTEWFEQDNGEEIIGLKITPDGTYITWGEMFVYIFNAETSESYKFPINSIRYITKLSESTSS